MKMLIPTINLPQVDFCWDPTYNKIVVTPDVYNNKTSQQAWRAGFREGVKMALDRGVKPNKRRIFKRPENLHRLWIWLMRCPRLRTETGNTESLRRIKYDNAFRLGLCLVRDFDYLEQLWAGRDSMPEDVLIGNLESMTDPVNELEISIAVQS